MYKSITSLFDVFNDSELDYLVKDINSKITEGKTSRNVDWGKEVVDYSKPIETFSLKQGQKNYDIISSKSKEITGKTPKLISYYIWGPGSYIPWHNDYLYNAALTLYLNEDWNSGFGGLFQYEINNQINTFIPTINTGVYQVGGINHSTTIQSSFSPLRKSIQCWFDDRKIKKTTI